MLSSPLNLITKAFNLYRQSPTLIAKFIGLIFIPTFFISLGNFSNDLMRLLFIDSIVGMFILIIVGTIALSLLSFWFGLGLIQAIADIENKSSLQKIGAYLKKTGHVFLPALWISILSAVVFIGGFILFIIPAFLFAIWFAFGIQANVLDGKKGITALSYSKNLVQGNWWKIFGRLILVYVVASTIWAIFQGILNVIFQTTPADFGFEKLVSISLIITILQAVLQSILAPFLAGAFTIMYLELQRQKSITPPPPPTE